MIVRRWAEFRSDLPDDQIEDGSCIVQFGGEGVTNAIAELLTDLGCSVGEPLYADEHGWELDIRAGRRRLWCQVTLVGHYMLVLKQKSWFANSFGLYQPEYLETLNGLAAALNSDARFHDVQWFGDEDVLSGKAGAATPISE